MKIPKSYKQITVAQYQELLPIYRKALNETDSIKAADHWCNIIAILADCQTEEVEALPINKLKDIIKSLAWLNSYGSYKKKFTLFHNGKLYKAFRTAKGFNTARYVEYKTFLGRGGLIENMHMILATIYQPYFKSKQTHEERAIEFRSAKMADVFPVVFFYSVAYRNSINRIQEYGLRLAKEKNKEAEKALMATLKEVLESTGVGTLQSTS